MNGPVKFPISYIGSDNIEGGRIAARGLAKAIGGKGTVYINSTNPNVSSVEDREKGFKEAMAKDFPNIKVLGPDYNLDDPNKATQQTAAVLAREPNLAGVFGTNVFSAQGARHGGRQRRARRPRPGCRLRRDQTGDRTDGQGRRVAWCWRRSRSTWAIWRCSSPRPTPPASPACRAASRPASPSSTRTNVKDPAIARFIYQVPGK